jgi:hypothetical protein
LTSPQVSGLSTSEGLTGRDEVKIRASALTRVNLIANNARKAIHSIVVSDIVQDLALSQYNPDTRAVKAVWTMPASTRFNTTYGQVRFDAPSTCGSQCFTSCCSSGSCTACTCAISCFALEYYDDLKPVISFSTALTGPEIGGTEILMTISKLPQVTSGTDMSVTFDGAFADVFVVSSSLEETKLKIYTPGVEMNRLSARTVPAQLVVAQHPDRKVDFSFEYTSVAVSVLSLSPSRGTSLGRQIVTVSIQYMPFPTVLGIDFDGMTLPDANMTVVTGLSNKLRTVVSFATPATLPGPKPVSIYMKSDPFGRKRASFTFLQIDASQPTAVAPLPSSGPTQPPANTIDFLRVSNFPSYQVTMTLSFAYANGTLISTTPNASVTSTSGGITTLAYMRPSSAEVTDSVATLVLTPVTAEARAVSENKTVTWEYRFFDGNAVRLLSRAPSSLPITTISYGRTIALQPDVQVRIANFPQDIGLKDVTTVLGGAIEAQVTSIVHTATCGTLGVDCNRTIVTFKSPQISSPVDWPVTISAFGAVIVRSTLTYFSPCDFDAYCGRFQLVTDTKWLVDNPPTNAVCVKDGACVDTNTLPQPTLRSMSPLSGTASGGTIITVAYTNLPAFLTSDVVVTFGTGALAVLASVSSIAPDQGSSLTQNSGVLRLLAPRVPGGNTKALTRVPIEISVSWGSIQRLLSTSFQYTPVVEGATVIDR